MVKAIRENWYANYQKPLLISHLWQDNYSVFNINLLLWTLNLWWSFYLLSNDTHSAFFVSKLLEFARTDCASNYRDKNSH